MISEWTKQQLSASLFKYMKLKSLDKISVKELTDDCGFPRSTFYYHFEDIYDLASWALADRMVAWLKEGDGCVLWGEGLLHLFQHAQENRDICQCAIDSSGLWRMADSYCERCMQGIIPCIRKLDGDRHTDPGFLQYLATFYAHAILGALIKWLRSGMVQTPEEMAELIDLLVKDNMIATLDRANRQKNIFNLPESLPAPLAEPAKTKAAATV